MTTKSTAMSPMRQPDLFYDRQNSLLYSLGGQAYGIEVGQWTNLTQQVQLWGFEPNNNTGAIDWELQAVGSTATFPLNEVVAGALTATSPTNHYSLGGYSNFATTGLSQFISYNFANQSWTNQTQAGNYYIGGRGQYIPSFGAGGIVLFFGGTWPTDGNATSTASLAGFNTVLVYDIASNTLFSPQQTTNPPSNRFNFCSVGAGAGSANSSYEM